MACYALLLNIHVGRSTDIHFVYVYIAIYTYIKKIKFIALQLGNQISF